MSFAKIAPGPAHRAAKIPRAKIPRVVIDLDLGPAVGPDVDGKGRAIDQRNILREIAIASLETTSPSLKRTKRVLESGSNAFIWDLFVKYSTRTILSAQT